VGTTQTTLVIALLAAAAPAHADSCTGERGGKFAACFDPGNRLSITAGTAGVGGAIELRHVIHFDDEPDLVWKLDHTLLAVNHGAWADRLSFTLYRAHYMRHSRDGHIVIPLGEPKKVFMHSDIGAYVESGTIEWRDQPTTRLGVVRVAGLVDFARKKDFSARVAFGPLARWDVDLMQDTHSVRAHFVAPFTAGMANLHLESDDGRTLGDVRFEAGAIWRSDAGWGPEIRGEASVERIVLAINDRPISLLLGARYESETHEAIGQVGARIVLLQRRDPRVSLE